MTSAVTSAMASVTIWLGGALLAGTAQGAPLSGIERYSGGARAEQTLPLVVVLHGFGATPKDIIDLVTSLAVPARLWAPHAPTAVGPGWSWFPPSRAPGFADVVPEIVAARDLVAQSIVDEVHAHPTCGRPIVVGFSQGGVLSWALAGQQKPVVGLALPIGGALPGALHPRARPGVTPRVRAFHGGADPRVDPVADRETQAAFASVGYDATLRTYPGVQHTITPAEAQDIRDAIADAVRAYGCATAPTSR